MSGRKGVEDLRHIGFSPGGGHPAHEHAGAAVDGIRALLRLPFGGNERVLHNSAQFFRNALELVELFQFRLAPVQPDPQNVIPHFV